MNKEIKEKYKQLIVVLTDLDRFENAGDVVDLLKSHETLSKKYDKLLEKRNKILDKYNYVSLHEKGCRCCGCLLAKELNKLGD